MQAIILAAGESSRFWPLSEGSHKSLIKIMGKPIIIWTIESIKNSGITDIIIIQSTEKEIEKIIGDGKNIGVDIKYIVQKEAKGMGDAIMNAEKLISDNFFVMNPNHTNIKKIIEEMIEKQNRNNSKMILACCKTDSPWNYGIVDAEDDMVKGIIEKPEKGKEPSNIRVTGIYLLPKDFFNYHRKTKENIYSYEDALQLIIKDCEVRMVILEEGSTTLKYPWDLFNVSREIMNIHLNEKFISSSAKIGKNVIIEGNVCVGENTEIFENVVIKGPCYIGNDCRIGNSSIIRNYSDIGNNCNIGANLEVSNTIIQEGTHIHNGFIGDSVIGKNCRIGAGIITANKRIDRKEIKSSVKGEEINTKLDSLGAIIGENTRLGIFVGTMPGVMIGRNVIIGPQTQVKENIESNAIYFCEFNGIKKNNLKQIKLIIFDADKTLYKIDNEKAYEKLYEFINKKIDIPKEKIREDHKKIIETIKSDFDINKRKYNYIIDLLFDKYKIDEKELTNKAVRLFWNEVIKGLVTTDSVIQLLGELNKNFRLVVSSEEFFEILDRKLKKTIGNWENLFEFLVTPEITKSMKPSREYYRIILEKTNLKSEEIIVIGDSWEKDLEPAKCMGIKTILLSNEKKGEPDYFIKDFQDIKKILLN